MHSFYNNSLKNISNTKLRIAFLDVQVTTVDILFQVPSNLILSNLYNTYYAINSLVLWQAINERMAK